MQRKRGDSRSTTVRQMLALASMPWTNTSAGPVPASKQRIVPCPTSSSRASPSSGARHAIFPVTATWNLLVVGRTGRFSTLDRPRSKDVESFALLDESSR
jgi:hypothetical protein